MTHELGHCTVSVSEIRNAAADLCEDPFCKDWLRRDEKGTWESRIEDLVLYIRVHRHDVVSDLSKEDILDQFAGILILEALGVRLADMNLRPLEKTS